MRLYDYQELDTGYLADVMREHGGAYLGWDRGLGKSLAALAIADDLECRRVLVIGPNTSKRSVWEPEIRRFMPWMEVVVLRNSKSQREKDLGYVQQLIKADMPFVLVVHFESLAIIGGQDGRGWKRFGEWSLVIADEVHRIANPKTKMARALKKIPTKYKLALSGSIIQNSAEELFSPLQWLHPDRYRSKWRDWNERYLDYVDGGYSRVCVGIKIEKLDDLRDELGRFMCVRHKSDELDLPPRTEQTLLVDLSPAQRKVYDELAESYFAELPDGSTIKASDGLALLLRLRQVATGLDFADSTVADSTKQDLAMELIADNPGEAFVIMSWFRQPAEAMEKRLVAAGIGCFRVDGDVGHNVRADYIRRFQAGEGRVFIGTISTLSESVNLMRASNMVFLDRSWNPADNLQAADRIFRIGQQNPVTISYLVARDTVDELRVTPVIRDKESLRALVLGG